MKKRPLIILLGLLITIAAAAGIIMYLTLPDRSKHQELVATDYSVDTCYYVLQPTNRETFDFAWIKFKLTDKTLAGTFNHYLGEAQSSTGTFTGVLGNYDATAAEHVANTTWNSKPLQIVFGGVIAKADGVTMNKVSCDDLANVIKNRGPKY